jgi:ABC-2 type transport system ATP-binding protein
MPTTAANRTKWPVANPLRQDAEITPAIRVEGLRKAFGDVEAVRGVTFSVAPGEIFAFLGPNGAGKSTCINVLCTLAVPTAGQAWIGGHDVRREPGAVRERIGLVFQDPTLDAQLTANENLRFHAVLYGVPPDQITPRMQRVLTMVDLFDRAGDLVSTFSGGMVRRLEIARGLMHAPEVLFLDEPTVGLDPQTRARIWADVCRLRDEESVTVFFSTHYMDEAEYADRVGIIDRGQLVAVDTPTALKSAVGRDAVYLQTADDTATLSDLQSAGIEANATVGGLVAFVDDGPTDLPGVLAAIRPAVRSVQVRRPTMDDVFLHFTGRELRDETVPGAYSPMRRAFARRR